jgi:hypothetical protein
VLGKDLGQNGPPKEQKMAAPIELVGRGLLSSTILLNLSHFRH